MSHCKICQSDNVTTHCEAESIHYKEQILKVDMDYSLCHSCGREFISKAQIAKNDVRVRDAKKLFDGLLTSTEIYQARRSLGLTQDQAATLFGGGKNAFSKYERGEVSQSAAMDKLIKICLKHPEIFKELSVESGIKV